MRFCCWIFIALLSLSAVSCGGRRKTVLTERKMEDVLFDWHLAEGMSRLEGADSARQRRYYELVLEKHGITKAEFDSSMIFYMKHADRMHGIYEHLSDRMANLGRLEGVEAGSLVTSLSLEGDTADLWSLGEKHLFTPYVPDNLLRYHIKADSTFHEGDKFILSFKTDFLYQEGARNGFAMFSVRFANDSVVTRTKQVSSGNANRLEIDDGRRIGAKEITGYFALRQPLNPTEQDPPPLKLMVISDIQLIKMHTQTPPDFVREEEKAKADTAAAKTDSLVSAEIPLGDGGGETKPNENPNAIDESNKENNGIRHGRAVVPPAGAPSSVRGSGKGLH